MTFRWQTKGLLNRTMWKFTSFGWSLRITYLAIISNNYWVIVLARSNTYIWKTLRAHLHISIEHGKYQNRLRNIAICDLTESFSFKLRMNASCMNHVCILNVSQVYHVFNILTETMDELQRMSINLFEK